MIVVRRHTIHGVDLKLIERPSRNESVSDFSLTVTMPQLGAVAYLGHDMNEAMQRFDRAAMMAANS